MRKKSLRQTANHYIQNNRSGCLRDKKQRPGRNPKTGEAVSRRDC